MSWLINKQSIKWSFNQFINQSMSPLNIQLNFHFNNLKIFLLNLSFNQLFNESFYQPIKLSFFYQSVNESIYQPIKLSFYQSVNESIYQSIKLSFYQFINQSMSQFINQSMSQFIKQWVNLSINQWVNLSNNQWVNLSIHQWVNLSIHQWVNLSNNQWVNLSIHQWVNLSINQWVNLSIHQWVNLSIRCPRYMELYWSHFGCNLEGMFYEPSWVRQRSLYYSDVGSFLTLNTTITAVVRHMMQHVCLKGNASCLGLLIRFYLY